MRIWQPTTRPRCAVCWFRRATFTVAGEHRCSKHTPAWAVPAPAPVVPLADRCSTLYPTVCDRKATQRVGHYQWCDEHMPVWARP